MKDESRRDLALTFEFDEPVIENGKRYHGGGDRFSVDKLTLSAECILCKKEMQLNMKYEVGCGGSAYRCDNCLANYVIVFDYEFKKLREERENDEAK